MREVISVHVGQAGVQIGNACCKCSATFDMCNRLCYSYFNIRRVPDACNLLLI